MKNYIQLWLCVLNDGGGNVLGYAFTPSLEEAQTFMTDNGYNAGPTQYYFPLSKLLVTGLISQYPWPVQADGTLTPNPTQYSRSRGDVLEWNFKNPLWQFDSNDKWQVQALKSAAKTLGSKTPIKFNLGGASALYNNFLAVMNNLIIFYQKKKDARTVGILKFYLSEFFAGRLSITDILQRLKNQFIVP
jgi:hypothetical protein